MAWYKTGNVSITNGSTSVTASNTKFASNTRVGDGFRAPDGKWYEIVNIASETVLGIYPEYQGVTVVESADYMIAPLQGYNKETADRLRIITDGIQDISEDVDAAAMSALQAQQSEDAAKISETNSKTSEDAAKVSEDNAKASELAAATSEDNASASQIAAAASETNANTSKNAAATSAANALTSENAANASKLSATASATSAATSESNALTSENNAEASEIAAAASESSASVSAATATTGATTATNAATSANADADRAEEARDDAIAAASTVTGNLMDQGPWDASTGTYPTKPAVSSFWKVVGNGSATDAGETISYGIGDTLMFSKPMENFYKIDNTENVSSVNGHTGVVVIDKTDVGLPNVDNTSDLNKPISTAQAGVNTAVTTTLGEKVPKTDIVDNLTSTDATKVLSAKQGKALYDLVQSNNATIVRYNFVATAGQTTVSGADANGVVLSYVPGTPMLVTLNGFDLNLIDDYSATTGTSLTMTQAMVAGDQLSVVVFGAFSTADHYTKAESDALTAPLFSVQWWGGKRTAIPTGHIPADGQTISRALYTEVTNKVVDVMGTITDASWVATPTLRGNWATGDGSTTWRVPDLNGKSAGTVGAPFLRGDGTLSAAVAGTIQMDAFQGHYHSSTYASLVNSTSFTAGVQSVVLQGANNGSTMHANTPVTDGSNGTPRTATETRPLNVTGCFIIKVFGAVNNTGSVDANQIVTTLGIQDSRIASLEGTEKKVYWSGRIGAGHINPGTGGVIHYSEELLSKGGLVYTGISTRTFTIPIGGVYTITCSLLSNVANTGASLHRIRGGNNISLVYGFSSVNLGTMILNYTDRFEAGDTLHVLVDAGVIYNPSAGSNYNHLLIERIDN